MIQTHMHLIIYNVTSNYTIYLTINCTMLIFPYFY